MRRSLRLIATLAVACVVIAAVLSGCGESGGLPDQVAVRIGSSTIDKASVEHWIPIETVLTGSDLLKTAPPKGLVPDPPDYTACIGYERKAVAEGTGGSNLTTSQLKSRCQQRWQAARIHTIDSLILYHWLLGEATERGWNVSDQEVRRSMDKNLHHLFKNSAEFHLYLESTGQTEADELHRTKNGLLANKILENVINRKGFTSQDAHLAYVNFLKKWISRTDCDPEYIAPDCKQYKGPLQPGT